ncbi:MAG: PAS domain-containing sensor histidine kinase [Bdellovibrionota bacterium]
MNKFNNPIRILIVLGVVIFAADFLVTVTLVSVMGHKLSFIASLLGSSALVLLLYLVLMYSVYNHMMAEMSNRKKAEENLRQVFEYSPYAILTIADETGIIIMVNPQAEKIFGYSHEELVGKKVEVLLPEQLRDKHVELRKKYMEAPEPRVLGVGRDLIGRRKDGSEVHVEIALTPIKILEKTAVLASVADITKRKNLEQQRDQALKAREELVAVVSHEIKNPLSAISIGLQVIQKTLPAYDGRGKVDTLIHQLQSAIKRMTKITSELLDVTRIEAGHMTLQPSEVAIAGIIGEVVEIFRPVATEKSINLEQKVSPDLGLIICDRDRIIQVLSNFVSNAIKFTGEKGSIQVKAERIQDKISFYVKDSGTGITEDQIPHVFERFWQANEKQYLGSGLGLYIAKNIVDAHGGAIGVNSKPGEGSTFYFTLPVSKVGEGRVPGSVASRPQEAA